MQYGTFHGSAANSLIIFNWMLEGDQSQLLFVKEQNLFSWFDFIDLRAQFVAYICSVELSFARWITAWLNRSTCSLILLSWPSGWVNWATVGFKSPHALEDLNSVPCPLSEQTRGQPGKPTRKIDWDNSSVVSVIQLVPTDLVECSPARFVESCASRFTLVSSHPKQLNVLIEWLHFFLHKNLINANR